MKIKSIKIEGMHNVNSVTYQFNNLNYFQGRNGAGKSTALQAVQLALLGYVPITGKSKGSIFRHSNNHTMAVTAVIEDSDRSITIQRIWTGVGSKATSTVHIMPEGTSIEEIVGDLELPIFNFDEFLAMTANNQKDWFIKFLPAASAAVDWETELNAVIKDITLFDGVSAAIVTPVKQIVAECEANNVPAIEIAQKLNVYLKNAASFKKTEIARIQNTIQSMIHYDDIDDVANKDEIMQQIAVLEAQKQTAIRYSTLEEQSNRIEAKIGQLDRYSGDLDSDEELQNMKSLLVEISERITEIESMLLALRSEKSELLAATKSKRSVVLGGGNCPYTHEQCDGVSNLIKTYLSEIDKSDHRVDSINSEIALLEGEYSELKQNCSVYNNKINAILQGYREYAAAIKNRISLPDISLEDRDLAAITAKLHSLQDTLVKIESNANYDRLIKTITNEKYVVEQTLEIIKLWTVFTGANGIQSTLAVQPFLEMEDKLNVYMSKFFEDDSVSAKFFLAEKANSFSFGIERNGKYISFDLLSSGEKCMYALALMSCIVADSASPLKLVLVDDMLDHLDDKNVDKVFAMLNNVSEIQYILAGVKECNIDDVVIHID